MSNPDEDLKALRLPGSDVFHYSRDGETPVCKISNGEKFNTEDAQIAEIDDAKQFFRVCSTCEQTYHWEYGLTTSELRDKIREELDTTDRSNNFDVDELMMILESVKE